MIRFASHSGEGKCSYLFAINLVRDYQEIFFPKEHSSVAQTQIKDTFSV